MSAGQVEKFTDIFSGGAARVGTFADAPAAAVAIAPAPQEAPDRVPGPVIDRPGERPVPPPPPPPPAAQPMRAADADASPVAAPAAQAWVDAAEEPVEEPVEDVAEDEPVTSQVVTAEGARSFLSQSPMKAHEAASWGARGRLVAATGGRLKLAPNVEEQAYLDDVRVIRRFTWARPAFNVMVATKARAGCTPTALLLADVMGEIRGGHVLALETADKAGGLARRAEGESLHGVVELLHAMSQIATIGQLEWFGQLQTSHARVLGSVADRPPLAGGHVTALRDLVDQYYSMSVTDAGSHIHSPAFAASVHRADALVVPTFLAIDSAADMLDTLRHVASLSPHGRAIASRAVVMVTHDGRPEDPTIAARIRQLLDGLMQPDAELHIAAVVEVPYELHIAARGEITLSALSAESRTAWTRLAATVLSTTQPRKD